MQNWEELSYDGAGLIFDSSKSFRNVCSPGKIIKWEWVGTVLSTFDFALLTLDWDGISQYYRNVPIVGNSSVLLKGMKLVEIVPLRSDITDTIIPEKSVSCVIVMVVELVTCVHCPVSTQWRLLWEQTRPSPLSSSPPSPSSTSGTSGTIIPYSCW